MPRSFDSNKLCRVQRRCSKRRPYRPYRCDDGSPVPRVTRALSDIPGDTELCDDPGTCLCRLPHDHVDQKYRLRHGCRRRHRRFHGYRNDAFHSVYCRRHHVRHAVMGHPEDPDRKSKRHLSRHVDLICTVHAVCSTADQSGIRLIQATYTLQRNTKGCLDFETAFFVYLRQMMIIQNCVTKSTGLAAASLPRGFRSGGRPAPSRAYQLPDV